MTIRFSTKTYLAMGQSFLLVSLMLLALFLNLFPDRSGAIRDGRAALAEAIAASSSAFISRADFAGLEEYLRFVAERNSDVLSLGLRRSGGTMLVEVGNHEQQWKARADDRSTDTYLRVPIWSGAMKWGEIELRCGDENVRGVWSVLKHDGIMLIAFLAIASFFVFYFYLGKMLKVLDPSRAVPPHVRSALDTLAGGLLVLDLHESIVLANQAFASLTDETADALVGKRASTLAWTDHEGRPLAADLPWHEALNDGSVHRNHTAHLIDTQNVTRTFIVNCSPVFGAGGKHSGVLVSFDDITLLEQKKVELSRSKEEAEAANRAKSEFLANMSHDIRTPMNAILGFTEILRRGYGQQHNNWQKHLDTIHTSGSHLLQLINDVLDLSKVESGHIEAEAIEFEPHVLIHEVVAVLSVQAREREIALEFLVEGEIPEKVHADPTRLRQIMTNLIGNALKFTQEGGVVVTLRSVDSQQTLMAIDIKDSGIGLPADKVEAVFDPFVQAEDSTTRRFGGTGLGLAISRRFARLMGGDVTVQSEFGVGSTFTVTFATNTVDDVSMINARQAFAACESLGEETRKQWRFAPARVLVVDDGDENRELVRLVLSEAGLTVEEACNGLDGSNKALANAYDVILMDMQMPVMDGFKATALLRSKNVTTPIIALTANAMKGFEKECYEAGCTAYLTKPIDFDVLQSELARFLAAQDWVEDVGHSTQPSISESESEAEATELSDGGEKYVTMESDLKSTLVASDARFRPIALRFVERLDEKLDELDEALAVHDMAEVAGLAHWLKGSGGTVGFGVFTEPAQHLEMLAKQGREDELPASIAAIRDLASRIDRDALLETAPSTATQPQHIPASNQHAEHEEVDTIRVMEDEPLFSTLTPQDPRYAKVVRTFVMRLKERLSEMDAACVERDFVSLKAHAHWLKGSGGTVGLDVFTEPAQRLESAASDANADRANVLLAEIQNLCARAKLGTETSPANDPAPRSLA